MKPTFVSIVFDEQSRQASNFIMSAAGELETTLEAFLSHSRETSIALTKLEECVMWANKAIRNDQIVRQEAENYKICANPNCGETIFAPEGHTKYCQNNPECAKERARQRQKAARKK